MTLLSEEAASFIRNLWNAYLKDRSYSSVISQFSNNVSNNLVLIGMGADEVRIGSEAVKNAIASELKETDGVYFEMSGEWQNTQEVSDNVCIVFGGFSMAEVAKGKRNLFADIDCRYSAMCRKDASGICLMHMHVSVPNIFQTSGEFFPKFINDRANDILQEEIEKKTAELDQLNEEFLEQEELYRVAISASDDIIVVIDTAKRTTEYDKEKIEYIYDIPVKMIESDGFFNVAYSRIHPDDKVRFLQVFNMENGNVYDPAWYESFTEPINSEYRLKHRKFGYMWICNTLIPIRNSKGQVIKIVAHIKNINEHKRREQELHGIAIRDGLTNLYNKTHTEQAVSDLLKSPDSSGALFMIDIDNFKSVNDSVGHLFADDVLKAFANILSSVFRENDIVGRFGGDEFIAYMKFKQEEGIVQKRADEILKRFDSYIASLGQVPFKTSCSIGIAMYPKDAKTFSELYKHADEAMYASKSAGKHKVSFYEEKTTCGEEG